MTIRFYSKSNTHREFSNFAPFPIDLDGERWPNVEHYYQAQKFADPELKAMIRDADEPISAKALAEVHRNKIRPDWSAVRDSVMEHAVRRKFELHPSLREVLFATGDEDIVEAVPMEYCWGIGRDGTGQNKLGKIVERIRAELRAAAGNREWSTMWAATGPTPFP